MSKKRKIELFALLIILNIILRFTFVPHEIGWDSFVIHILANLISTFGYATWWIHPTSIFGLYPYSVASVVPFFLSGISQCTNVSMESVIFLCCVILGFFSIFATYLIAGLIWNDDFFKFIVAFVFSTSQGIVTYTTWTTPARTLFVVLLPLFIYMILKIHIFKIRFSILTFIILVLLLATHHYIYFTAPIIISYFVTIMFLKFGKYIKSSKITENFVSIGLLISFIIMFVMQFFTRTFFEIEKTSSRYEFMFVMAQSYGRYIGPLILFAIGGYVYLSLKHNKRLEEWVLLLALVSLAPFLYIPTYMKWFIVLFASLLIGISVTNIANIKIFVHTKKKCMPSLVIIIILLFSISFTGYYQYLHFLNDPSPRQRYMEERTYIGALWMMDNINKDKNTIVESYICPRVLAISKVPTLSGGPSDLAYGFVNLNKSGVKQVHSPLSVEFYFHDPYKIINQSTTEWVVGAIERTDINAYYSYAWRLVREFNLFYYVENEDIATTFSRSVQQTKDNIYDNGKIRIWVLD